MKELIQEALWLKEIKGFNWFEIELVLGIREIDIRLFFLKRRGNSRCKMCKIFLASIFAGKPQGRLCERCAHNKELKIKSRPLLAPKPQTNSMGGPCVVCGGTKCFSSKCRTIINLYSYWEDRKLKLTAKGILARDAHIRG